MVNIFNNFTNFISKSNIYSIIEEIKHKTFWIYGPPGTGKTTYLLNIVEKKIKEGYEPYEIAYISFTRAARNEARYRAINVKSITPKDLSYFKTIHSIAYKRLGLKKENVFLNKDLAEFGKMYGFSFSRFILNEDLEDDLYMKDFYSSTDDALITAYNFSRNKLINDKEKVYGIFLDFLYSYKGGQVFKAGKRYRFDNFLSSYYEFSKAKNKLDFTSMLLQDIEDFGNEGIDDVKIAIIDEAQDLTPLQFFTVLRWFKDCKELYFAGDDDQAIYTFQGADYEIMLKAHKIVPKSNQKVLNTSYRVPSNIAYNAKMLIDNVKERVKKQWKSVKSSGEITYLPMLSSLSEIEQDLSRNIFILCRNRQFFDLIAHKLIYFGIPYQIEGFAIAPNPLFSKKIVGVVNSIISLRKGKSITTTQLKSILDYIKVKDGLIPRGFKARIDRLKGKEELKFFLSNIEFLGAVKLRQAIENNPRLIFESKYGKYRSYYEDLIRRGKEINNIKVRIKTIHSAKGQEADVVIIDPSLSALAGRAFQRLDSEEFRIAYVATTRAKEKLCFLPKQSFYYFKPYFSFKCESNYQWY